MTDLERLDEAIANFDNHSLWEADEDLKHIIPAARAYRDLVANGERKLPISSANVSGVELRVVVVPDDVTGPVLLVDPPKGEE